MNLICYPHATVLGRVCGKYHVCFKRGSHIPCTHMALAYGIGHVDDRWHLQENRICYWRMAHTCIPCAKFTGVSCVQWHLWIPNYSTYARIITILEIPASPDARLQGSAPITIRTSTSLTFSLNFKNNRHELYFMKCINIQPKSADPHNVWTQTTWIYS